MITEELKKEFLARKKTAKKYHMNFNATSTGQALGLTSDEIETLMARTKAAAAKYAVSNNELVDGILIVHQTEKAVAINVELIYCISNGMTKLATVWLPKSMVKITETVSAPRWLLVKKLAEISVPNGYCAPAVMDIIYSSDKF
jgi:hypothetical protein